MFPFDSVSSFFMDLGSETRGKRNPFVFIKWGVAIKRNAMIEYHRCSNIFFALLKLWKVSFPLKTSEQNPFGAAAIPKERAKILATPRLKKENKLGFIIFIVKV